MRSEAAALSPEGPGDPLSGRRVLLLISGSIAAVKLPLVVSALVQRGVLVRCVPSPSAERLVSAVALASLSRAPCHVESDQWSHRAARPLQPARLATNDDTAALPMCRGLHTMRQRRQPARAPPSCPDWACHRPRPLCWALRRWAAPAAARLALCGWRYAVCV